MKRVAVFVPGGIGKPDKGEPIAALERLMRRLGAEFEITVYSLSHCKPALEAASSYQLKAVNARHSDPLVPRMLRLASMFCRDHRGKRFHLLHALWAVPPGFLAILLGKAFGIPVIVSLQGGEAACLPEIAYGNMLSSRLRRATLWVCRKAGMLTALTEFQRRSLQNFGLRREDIRIIPHGVDRGLFKPSDKIFKPPFRFLHVANLTEVKDQKTLLRAFSLIHRQVDSRLRIIGPDYLNGQLERLAAELEIARQVEFCGYISHSRLPAHYQWAHLMLHTSLYEGQGIVIAEAAASGVAVCGTRTGLIADLGDACTVSAEPGDAPGLAKKVLELLQQPEQIETKRRKALEWASAHDAGWTAGQFGKLYNRLMNQNHES